MSLDDGRAALVDLQATAWPIGGLGAGAGASSTAGLPDDSTVELARRAAVAGAVHGLGAGAAGVDAGRGGAQRHDGGALQWTLAQTASTRTNACSSVSPSAATRSSSRTWRWWPATWAAATMAARVVLADADGPSARAAAAKVRAYEAAIASCRIAHQVHGAIGFTQEHALHLRHAPAWAWRDSSAATPGGPPNWAVRHRPPAAAA